MILKRTYISSGTLRLVKCKGSWINTTIMSNTIGEAFPILDFRYYKNNLIGINNCGKFYTHPNAIILLREAHLCT